MTSPTLPTALAAIGMQSPESAKSIDEIHDAFSHVHNYAMHKTTTPYMSIPARPGVDADLVVSAAIVELGALRALCLALAVRVKEGQFELEQTIKELRARCADLERRTSAAIQRTTLCGGCGRTYLSPRHDDEHGFGKCVDENGGVRP